MNIYRPLIGRSVIPHDLSVISKFGVEKFGVYWKVSERFLEDRYVFIERLRGVD